MKFFKVLAGALIAVISSQLIYQILVVEVIADEHKRSAEKAIFSKYVDDRGNISLPDDFRIKMVHLGSWLVPEGAASGFHDVYTEAETAKVYRETGKFPDGATLVKELRPAKNGNYTTGANVAYASNEIKQWFVMIKDTQGRFKGHDAWGAGWGWALIKKSDKKLNHVVNYKADCIGCHIPAKKTDWVYIEAYPSLLKAPVQK